TRHPKCAKMLGNLGAVSAKMEDFAKAESFYLEALKIYKEALGEKHPEYALCLKNLAEFRKSVDLGREAAEILRTALGEKHVAYSGSMNNLAELYYNKEAYQQAALLIRKGLQATRADLELASGGQSEDTQLAVAALLRYQLDLYLSVADK